MFGEFKNVYDVLKKDDRLVASDGTLMKNRIYELSSKLDETFLLQITLKRNASSATAERLFHF